MYKDLEKKKRTAAIWRAKNRERIHNYNKKNKTYLKNWYRKNKEKVIQRSKDYYETHKVQVLTRTKNWQRNHKDIINKTRRVRDTKRRKEEPEFRIKKNLSRRLRKELENTNYKINNIMILVGCDRQQLKQHLESKFYPNEETGEMMTWDNYGVYGWHIDHIKPCSSFKLESVEEQKICFNWTNLQPLWWKENISKGDKISE